MDINRMEQLVGGPLSNYQHPVQPKLAPDISLQKQPETQPAQPEELVQEIEAYPRPDPASPSVQKSTLKMVNSLLKYHNIALEASLTRDGQQVYIALDDVETGHQIKRMTVEEVLLILTRGGRIVDDSV
ncbi:hypothetical protein [Vibrio quintilis]|uniref:Uncharacterized protein n=1 Tax=Vibrio quintilis TaxID=1117707 RepID=A0A1M7YX82_9VIBR|nr:hypothetical protein [Vibrio quintilis]SHO57267.1 hypothetical protein VQ7734_03036 [Vibrio quintilis]